jgi:hypothetical protein
MGKRKTENQNWPSNLYCNDHSTNLVLFSKHVMYSSSEKVANTFVFFILCWPSMNWLHNVKASPPMLSMQPCKNISHIQV